jgi:hypothetical protein
MHKVKVYSQYNFFLTGFVVRGVARKKITLMHNTPEQGCKSISFETWCTDLVEPDAHMV